MKPFIDLPNCFGRMSDALAPLARSGPFYGLSPFARSNASRSMARDATPRRPSSPAGFKFPAGGMAAFFCSLSPAATLPRDWGFQAGAAFAALAPVDYGDAPPTFFVACRPGVFAGSNSFFKQLRESRDSVRAVPSPFDPSIVATLIGARTEIAPPKSRASKE